MTEAIATRKVPGKVRNIQTIGKTRAIVSKWLDPDAFSDGTTEDFDEGCVQHYVVELWRAGAKVDERITKGNRVSWPMTKTEAALTGYSTKVYSVGVDGDTGDVVGKLTDLLSGYDIALWATNGSSTDGTIGILADNIQLDADFVIVPGIGASLRIGDTSGSQGELPGVLKLACPANDPSIPAAESNRALLFFEMRQGLSNRLRVRFPNGTTKTLADDV